MQKRVNSQFLKELNEVRILNLIKSEGLISRIELARRTRISKVAVSEIVSRLTDAGFILEVGKGESTKKGGKKPFLIRINPDNGYVIGVEIRRKSATIALANLDSQIVDSEMVAYPAGLSIDDALESIFTKIDLLISHNDIKPEKLISIAIGVPGFIDYDKGQLIFADTIQGWGSQPLAHRFADRFRVPVFIDNDVNMMALGEFLLGSGKDESNLVYIWIGEGIGAGIIVEGQLLRGRNGSAGEIGYLELGHLIAEKAQFKMLYSDQKYVGEMFVEERLMNTLRKSLYLSSNDDSLVLESIGKDEAELPAQAIETLNEYARLIAVVCSNLIKTLNTNMIILSGKIIESSPYLLKRTKEFVAEIMGAIPFQPTIIVQGELRNTACIKGTIAMALQVVFSQSIKDNALRGILPR